MPISEPIARENRVIFSRGEREFTVGEIIDCAVLRGEIDPLWDEFVRIAECDRLANEQGLEPDESSVDAAAIAFRYQHDLITAEETERWLESRGVSLGEFGEYFARRYWGRTDSGATQMPTSTYQTAAAAEKDELHHVSPPGADGSGRSARCARSRRWAKHAPASPRSKRRPRHSR